MNTPRGRFLPLGKSAHITEKQVPDAPETCLTGTCLYRNERDVRTKQTNKPKSCTPHWRAAVSFEGEEFLSEDQRNAVLYFNAKLAPLGWLPVRKYCPEYTPKLADALEIFEADDVRRLVDAVAENATDVSVPKRKTLARLLWSNFA